MNWLGFWVFLSVVYACETYLYSKGHNGLLHKHKTEEEIAIRDRQAGGKP